MTSELRYLTSKPININGGTINQNHLPSSSGYNSSSPMGTSPQKKKNNSKQTLKCSSSSSTQKINQSHKNQHHQNSIHISSSSSPLFSNSMNMNLSTHNCFTCKTIISQPMFTKETPKEKLSYCSMMCFASNH
ncbi:hypothetical protein DLAC_09343 [Tieghemostelium lacteum]|uniref:Uncharacterized protein n=1 Tax=Tieghemostelium lacteum TaxID=361077 RepID=A0A151Z9S5_TIELA|nr:hypothetical protein DLAC_09343 [Tieghemostelium lacteum]|eukprot:KYQ90708.1 hypothetical protein DLAC_09343 [Tieghemostelium lacteum]